MVNIDSINAVDMIIGLTIEINLKWKDRRLIFLNILENEVEAVNELQRKQLWLPMGEIVHENAVIGEIKQSARESVSVRALTGPKPQDVGKATEDLVYTGDSVDLSMAQRFKINYNCLFDMRKFPFEKQSCKFIMKIKTPNNTTVSFREDNAGIIYLGPTVLNEYKVEDWKTATNLSHSMTEFIFSISIGRLYLIQLITTFFETFLLWMLAYLTLYFDIENFSDRVMASITSLVVMAALLASLKEHLPQTSYFKFIDLWFMWHIINIFLIFAYHVILNSIIQCNHKIGQNVNYFAKFIIFPLVILLFYIMFFYSVL